MNTFLNDRIPIEEGWATTLAALVYHAKIMPEGIPLTEYSRLAPGVLEEWSLCCAN
jgi:hypothetical protein